MARSTSCLAIDVILNQAMPNMGVANATPIAFGDLQSSYMLRTDGQPTILRLAERFADSLEQGFLLFTRCGGTGLVATGDLYWFICVRGMGEGVAEGRSLNIFDRVTKLK